MQRDPIVAVALLTESNLKAIGKNLERVYPLHDGSDFAELLAAIAEAERRNKLEGGALPSD